MIPKIIHYCWFGPNDKPELALKCIDSWKKYCNEYQLIEWNEQNFDINSNPYVKEAYESKRYAFVTDYVRLYALYTYGGVYMDTDVEVVKNIDCFLKYEAFSGFESMDRVPTGIMACRQGFPLFGELKDYYIGRHFMSQDGKPDLTTNVQTITNILGKKGLVKNNSFQEISGFALFPSEYFSPKDFESGKLTITENTYTIHHYNGSWKTEEEEQLISEYKKFTNIFGEKMGNLIFQTISAFRKGGIIHTMRKIKGHVKKQL